ncbi:MAG: putative Ig domain-containing protein, partial [Oscillatoria sp. PMC 1051.18]|nr:putative Ig domain-containing protein [Oscillatoria sp. PMC 1050.18]MEC5033328.1 putative Ig domain-containing protein [Oscillatoria sp. PMC 1051.18]
ATTTQTYNLIVQSTPINHPPTITSTPIQRVDTNSTYTYLIIAEDLDGDTLNYELIDAPPQMTLDETTGELLWSNPIVGNHQIIIAVNDGNLGAAQSFSLQAFDNLPPVINSASIPPTTVNLGAVYRYDVSAFDPNGGNLTYSIDPASTQLGITIDEFGRLRWSPSPDNAGITQPVTITVTDESQAVTTQNLTISVVADNSPPQVNLQPSRVYLQGDEYLAHLNQEFVWQVTATDNLKVESLQLFVNNLPVALDRNALARFTPNQVGNLTATAIATDTSGNTAQTTVIVKVIDPNSPEFNDPDAPEINLDLSNLVEGVITQTQSIMGTVDDDNLDYYVLEVAPINGDGEWLEIYRGTNSVISGVIGEIDPSLLLNDSYQLRLRAVDVAGNEISSETEIEVASKLKLGNFQLSFTDLEIPVAGIPISLTRTYDSLTANRSDNFGYGWRLEFRDTDLTTSLGYDEQFEVLGIPSQGLEVGDKVFITLPGGERSSFTFAPKLHPEAQEFIKEQNHLIPPYLGQALDIFQVPAFSADDDNGVTLSVKPVTLFKKGDLHYHPSGIAYNPAYEEAFGGRYYLTTASGIEYEIDANSGDLIAVTDPNGNKLTYSEGGIFSDTGVGITFERDN